MNLGQLALLLRGKYLVDVQSVTKVQGVAFLADEVEARHRRRAGRDAGRNRAETRRWFARLAAATVVRSAWSGR